jgi:hypothetical protein
VRGAGDLDRALRPGTLGHEAVQAAGSTFEITAPP